MLSKVIERCGLQTMYLPTPNILFKIDLKDFVLGEATLYPNRKYDFLILRETFLSKVRNIFLAIC
jgi:hypothetical protein